MVDPLDDVDPYATEDDISQTATGQAQARGDRSYSSIGSAVNIFGDDDSGPSSRANRLAQQNMRQERPSFLERVSNKLSNVFGGIPQPSFDIQKPEFDPTGFYRSLPRRAEKLGGAIADKFVPGRDTPLGMVPSLIGGKLGAGLSLANFMAGKKPEIDSFVDSILGKKDKPESVLTPTPTVAQFRQGERDALDPRNLATVPPSVIVDIPVEEANPAGLSQLQRSLGGLPVEVRGGGGGSTREGGLGDFVAIASPMSRPDRPVLIPVEEANPGDFKSERSRRSEALGVPSTFIPPDPGPSMQALELNPLQVSQIDTSVLEQLMNSGLLTDIVSGKGASPSVNNPLGPGQFNFQFNPEEPKVEFRMDLQDLGIGSLFGRG